MLTFEKVLEIFEDYLAQDMELKFTRAGTDMSACPSTAHPGPALLRG